MNLILDHAILLLLSKIRNYSKIARFISISGYKNPKIFYQKDLVKHQVKSFNWYILFKEKSVSSSRLLTIHNIRIHEV